MSEVVRAARGTELSCKGWVQEAALRMLQNNLDPEVAERPQDLVVYGGTGKAARSWEAFDVIVRELRALENDETLLVQSGKAVGVFRTHADAPRVLIANSNLVGKWATWEHFRELEAAGLMMYGQMTAGSWIYIGTQGILQGTYETFVAARQDVRRAHDQAGTRSCSRAGSAAWAARSRSPRRWPAASCLGVEVDPDAHRAAPRDPLRRRAHRRSRQRARAASTSAAREGKRGQHRPVRQRRRGLPRAREARRHARSRHRADRRARSARRLHPAGLLARRGRRRCARTTPRRYVGSASREHGRSRSRRCSR